VAGYAAVSALVLISSRTNPEWFVHFGTFSPVASEGKRVLGTRLLVTPGQGQDGQTFWLMARDPLLAHPAVVASREDRPAYREQRVLYPLLAAPLRLLGEQPLVWALLLVNLAAVAFGAYWAAQLAEALGAHPWLPLAFLLNPVVVVSLLYDTADALAVALVLCGLTYWYRDRRSDVWWAAVAFVFAALAKEIMFLVPIVLAIAALARRQRRDAAIVISPALAALVGWGLYERARLGWPATRIVELTWPFNGFHQAYVRGWQPFHQGGQAAVAIFCLIAMALAVAAWLYWRSDVVLAAVPFALLFVCLSSQVLDLGLNSIRATGPALTLLAFGAAEQLRGMTAPTASGKR
jgi:hypothetical protein